MVTINMRYIFFNMKVGNPDQSNIYYFLYCSEGFLNISINPLKKKKEPEQLSMNNAVLQKDHWHEPREVDKNLPFDV